MKSLRLCCNFVDIIRSIANNGGSEDCQLSMFHKLSTLVFYMQETRLWQHREERIIGLMMQRSRRVTSVKHLSMFSTGATTAGFVAEYSAATVP